MKIPCHAQPCKREIASNKIVCSSCWKLATPAARRGFLLVMPFDETYAFAMRDRDRREAIELLLDTIRDSKRQLSLF